MYVCCCIIIAIASTLAGGFQNELKMFLQGKGFSFTTNESLAVVQGILRDSNGNVTAHSDSRKEGQATVL